MFRTISRKPIAYPCLRKSFVVADQVNNIQELQSITDETIYWELQVSDQAMGRWTAEDPSLRGVQQWVRTRR